MFAKFVKKNLRYSIENIFVRDVIEIYVQNVVKAKKL